LGNFKEKNSCAAKSAERKNCAIVAMDKKNKQVLSTNQVQQQEQHPLFTFLVKLIKSN